MITTTSIVIAETASAASDRWQRWLVGAVGLLPVLFYLFMVLRFWGMLQDDSYIGFRYVDNFLAGHGLVFNPGEYVEGYTSPLWLLLIAAVSPVLSRPLAVKVLGVSCGLATGLLIFLWVRRLAIYRGVGTRRAQVAAAMALGFYFTDFGVVYYSVSGLETILSGLMATASAIAVYEDLRAREARYSWLLLGLAVWVRPEAILLIVLSVGIMVAGGMDRRQLLRLIVITAIVVAPLFICRRLIYGQWQANTFAAKVCFGFGTLKLAAAYVLPCLYHFGKPVVLLFWLLGFRTATRRLGLLGAIVLTLPLVVVLTLIVLAGGDWMGHLRFLVPSFGTVSILAGLGVAAVVGNRHWGVFEVAFLGCVMLLLLAAGSLAARHQADEEDASMLSGPSAIWNGGRDSRSDPFVANWIKGHVAPYQWVAYDDMGLVPYLNPKVNFIDFHGLITAEVSRLEDAKRNISGVWDDELDAKTSLARLLVKKHPEFILSMPRPIGLYPIGTCVLGGAYEACDAIDIPHDANVPRKCVYCFKHVDR